MSVQRAETVDEEASSSQSPVNRVISTLENRSRDGSLAMLAGGVMVLRALATIRKEGRRATPSGATGVVLLGFGVRQRRIERSEDETDTGADARRDEEGEKRVSDAAHAQAEQSLGAQRNADESASVHQSETDPNPRGTSDRSDVRTDEGGDIDFVEGEEPGAHRETHLEKEDAHDPRIHPDSDDEPTEVDLSEAAMADEASEAAGPHPEQAYPAREGTDPEPTSEKAPDRSGEGAVAPAGSNGDEHRSDDETRENDDGPAELADERDLAEERRESANGATEVESANDEET